MNFKIKADAEFEAENIDDAMKKLGKYFLSKNFDGPDRQLFDKGSIEVGRVNE